MKKKITILVSMLLIVFIGVSVFHNIGKDEVLSKEEIERLREQYPINDKVPPSVDIVNIPLERWIGLCDTYVEVEIIGEPEGYSRTVTINPNTPEGAVHDKAGGITEFEFVKYEAKIVRDIFNNYSEEIIELSYSLEGAVSMPSMEVGQRFIVGGAYSEKYDNVDIVAETMFYVTEDDYVLSVQSEQSRNRYTGYKVDALIEYLQTTKMSITSADEIK